MISKYIYVFISIVFLVSCSNDDVLIKLNRNLDITKTTVADFTKYGYHFAYGDIKVLGNNKLVIIASKAEKIDDLAATSMVSFFSQDGGVTWSEPHDILPNIGNINVTSPNIVKIDGKHFIMVLSVKNSTSDIKLVVLESFDNCLTWSKPRYIEKNIYTGYNMLVNGRILKKDQTILLPFSYVKGSAYKQYNNQKIGIYYSNDDGVSWGIMPSLALMGIDKTPFMEPSLVVFDDNEYLIGIRTLKKTMFFARSKNNGKSWYVYDSNIPSPPSPQTLALNPYNNILYLLWNNNDKMPEPDITDMHRTPLSLAVSKDKGYTFQYIADIETDKNKQFSYVSLDFDANYTYILYNEMLNGNDNRGKSSLVLSKIKNEKK